MRFRIKIINPNNPTPVSMRPNVAGSGTLLTLNVATHLVCACGSVMDGVVMRRLNYIARRFQPLEVNMAWSPAPPIIQDELQSTR